MISLSEGGLADLGNNNVGTDPQGIKYPGVFTCITLTCVLSNARLVGAHLGRFMTNERIAQNLAHMLTLANNNAILSIYIVGMLTKSWSPPIRPGNYNWGNLQMVALFRQGLQTNCPVHCFDTTNIAETVNIRAEAVGTHAAFIDVKAADGHYNLIRPHQFITH